MNRKLPLVVVCAALTALAVAPLRGHECPGGGDDELVTGLLSRHGDMELMRGSVTEELRAHLSLPEGTRFVGSAVQENLTLVVAVVPLEGKQARQAVESALTRAYWSLPPDVGPAEGGFVSSERSRSVAFCGQKGEFLTGWLREHPQGSLLTLHYVRSAPGECGKQSRVQPRQELATLLPRLEPPESARWVRGGGGGGSGSGEEVGDTAHRHALIETDLAPAELAEHFGSQLEAAGWQRDAVAAGTVSTIQVWIYRSDQVRLIGELTAAVVEPRKVLASFKVTRAAASSDP